MQQPTTHEYIRISVGVVPLVKTSDDPYGLYGPAYVSSWIGDVPLDYVPCRDLVLDDINSR